MYKPSTMLRTASSAGRELGGATNAKLRIFFPFKVRAAVPATRRKSALEKVFALPPPTSKSRFAFTFAGACTRVVSKILPVTSPDATTQRRLPERRHRRSQPRQLVCLFHPGPKRQRRGS